MTGWLPTEQRSEATTSDPTAAGSHFQLYRSSIASPVRWRLLGGNHRPIGRSPLDFPDVAECLLSLAELVRRLPELDGHLGRVPGNQWSWRLSHLGTEVAIAAHPYDRQIRCLHAQTQFRQRAATARIDEAVMINASRRWRSLPGPGQREPAR
ncbi:MAG: hypothetical protein M3Y42_13695 [Actinomycetota bacterium]|nr:hypothetical protein [Actinomycetota bacterium]MDQ2958007.1 hypothetical protein [Actinomycetota bacterium]